MKQLRCHGYASAGRLLMLLEGRWWLAVRDERGGGLRVRRLGQGINRYRSGRVLLGNRTLAGRFFLLLFFFFFVVVIVVFLVLVGLLELLIV